MILHACEMLGGLWPCLSCVGRFLPLLALFLIVGVVQRCLISAWRYLALLTFAGVAGRSCTLPLEARGSILDGFWKDFGKILGTFWEYVDTFWPYLQ